MAEALRLFILAGEPSGDRIGSDLVQRLRARGQLELSGVGGTELIGEGLVSLFPMEDLAVMGYSDVIRRLPLLLWRVRQVARAIIRQRPDVAVLIDAQVFSQLVAQRVRRAAPDIPLLLYVGPTVWAMRPERAAKIAPLFNEVLAILPFEPAVMKKLGGPPTSYVGHPALVRQSSRALQPETGPMLLLPGSRLGELRRHLPLMRAVAEALAGHPRITGFIIPTLGSIAGRLAAEVAGWDVPVKIVTGPDRAGAFANAYAAFAVSGTITLELALAGVPQVVTYSADAHQAKGYRKLDAPMIGLPNIIAGRRVVPEVLFAQPDPPRAIAAIRTLIDDPQAIEAQRRDYLEIRALMQEGTPEAPLLDPVDRVLANAGGQRLRISS